MSEEKKEQQLEEQAKEATEAPEPKQQEPAAKADSTPADNGGDQAPKAARLDPAERAAKRAAAAAAKAAARGEAGDAPAGQDAQEEQEKPKEPSPKQPYLDKIEALIREHIGAEAVEEAYINETDLHLPVVVVKNELWFKTAVLLRDQLQLDYLINLSGVDYENYMEVVYHIESLQTGEQYGVKVRTDRDAPSIASVTPVWSTANWPEREVYDLLGIDFPGHPDLRRIMMPDDWVGHPLRKDYEPLDPEV